MRLVLVDVAEIVVSLTKLWIRLQSHLIILNSFFYFFPFAVVDRQVIIGKLVAGIELDALTVVIEAFVVVCQAETLFLNDSQ